MAKKYQDFIIVLKDGRKLPCTLDVNQRSGDIDIELQQLVEDDYDQIDRLDPWKDVVGVELEDGNQILCNALYPDRSVSVSEVASYQDLKKGLSFMGLENEKINLLQSEDIKE